MSKFLAKNVTVQYLSDIPTLDGVVMDQDCHLEIPEHRVPVTFDHQGPPVGWATIKRKGKRISADIAVSSPMEPLAALRLIKLLHPSLEFIVIDVYENKITAARICTLSLIPEQLADPKIKPLGAKVRCASPDTRKGLH